MSTAERNRALKKVLEQAFGRGKVRVQGSRGTAYGWVSVRIAHAPRNMRESQELRSQVMALIARRQDRDRDLRLRRSGFRLRLRQDDQRQLRGLPRETRLARRSGLAASSVRRGLGRSL